VQTKEACLPFHFDLDLRPALQTLILLFREIRLKQGPLPGEHEHIVLWRKSASDGAVIASVDPPKPMMEINYHFHFIDGRLLS
jgi:hypothetical protein